MPLLDYAQNVKEFSGRIYFRHHEGFRSNSTGKQTWSPSGVQKMRKTLRRPWWIRYHLTATVFWDASSHSHMVPDGRIRSCTS